VFGRSSCSSVASRMRRSRGRWVCVPRVCGVGGGCGSKAALRPCGGVRPPVARPSWTTPRSRWSGPPLEQGARAHGFEADLWTLERVGAVVTRATGVVLSRASVWRLLTGRLGWSLQRPERRAVERDESEFARWIAHEWPRIKKGP